MTVHVCSNQVRNRSTPASGASAMPNCVFFRSYTDLGPLQPCKPSNAVAWSWLLDIGASARQRAGLVNVAAYTRAGQVYPAARAAAVRMVTGDGPAHTAPHPRSASTPALAANNLSSTAVQLAQPLIANALHQACLSLSSLLQLSPRGAPLGAQNDVQGAPRIARRLTGCAMLGAPLWLLSSAPLPGLHALYVSRAVSADILSGGPSALTRWLQARASTSRSPAQWGRVWHPTGCVQITRMLRRW